MTDRRPGRRLGGVAAVLVLTCAAACTTTTPPSTITVPTSTGTPSAGTPSAQPSASASVPPAVGSIWPLTGKAGSGDGAAVVVPVEVTSKGRHATGVDSADIVEMEYVESGGFRLVGVYQSDRPKRVGPLTMVRPSDAKIFSQTDPVFVQTGSPAGFVLALTTAKLSYQTAKAGHGGVDSSHGDLYVDTSTVAASSDNAVPQQMFQYADPGEPVASSDVKTVGSLAVKVPGHATVTWRFDSSAKVWRASVDGYPVSAENILVLKVDYTTKYVSGLKRHLTFASPTGQGDASIVASDQSVSGIWSKKNFSSALNLLCSDENVPNLTPGRTWIVVVPSGSSVTIK